MADTTEYTPPKVWTWNKDSGGRFANINRPIAGPTHDKELPVGKHPFQLYSLATPNGIKVTVMLEELLQLLPQALMGEAGGKLQRLCLINLHIVRLHELVRHPLCAIVPRAPQDPGRISRGDRDRMEGKGPPALPGVPDDPDRGDPLCGTIEETPREKLSVIV